MHGAVRDTVAHAVTVAERELAAAVDNPVVLPDGRVESNGNFHGAPVAYVLDFLAIAVADLAGISERRTDRHLDVARSHGLPAFLADDAGRRLRPHDRPVHAGGDRVRAQAAGGAGVGRLDTVVGHAGGPRVHGLVGRPQAARAVDGLTRVVAIELLTAARSLDLRRPLHARARDRRPSGTRCAVSVPGPGPDRHLGPEIDAAVEVVASGRRAGGGRVGDRARCRDAAVR